MKIRNKQPHVTRIRTTLNLHRDKNGQIVDEYGRVLEEYRNEQGKMDLRPVGLAGPDGNVYR